MELKTMKNQTSFTHLRGLKLAALAIGTSFVLAGCAGNPPTEQYAVTQSAVNSAVSAGGTEFAAVEMKQAQDKLKQAEIAMHDKKYEEARTIVQLFENSRACQVEVLFDVLKCFLRSRDKSEVSSMRYT